MVLTILMIWLALAALAVLFVYCCSRVSNGATRDVADDEFAAEPSASTPAFTWGIPKARDTYFAPRGQ